MTDIPTLVNGEACETISINDRGLQFGDGLFETLAWVAGRFPLWEAHMQRLTGGCKRLAIPCPDTNLLLEEAQRVLVDQPRGVLKIVITRGNSRQGYRADDRMTPNRVLSGSPWPQLPADYWEKGIALTWCRTRLAQQALLAGIKHLNRLEQVLARAELNTADVQEGLLCDSEGNVIEATAHNVFFINNDTFITPALHNAGVEGVMRGVVLAWLSQQGYKTEIRKVSRGELMTADGVFLCNSVHGIWPVRSLDETSYTVPTVVRDLIDHIAMQIPYQ